MINIKKRGYKTSFTLGKYVINSLTMKKRDKNYSQQNEIGFEDRVMIISYTISTKKPPI
ncbi:hypothetical protein [Myroides odoratimimus]|uniref:hypothetical protein n=1 Tax=Myroides odoratimimus TaxID=76832 RepID=UPI001CE143AF|nr:hypothetical protein [Myroides odoratimimus]MCA4805494.1 hypothetical protein [Myroides odoratimimus]